MTATAGRGTAAPPPLEIDGSLEQRDELAALVVELGGVRRKILDDYDRACAILSTFMRLRGVRSFSLPDGTTFELRRSTEYWCRLHSCPPSLCDADHRDGTPVTVERVEADSFVTIRKPKLLASVLC